MRYFVFLLIFSGAVYSQADVRLTSVAEVPGVVDIRNAGDGSNRLFLVTQGGSVFVVKAGSVLDEPFIDIRSRISLGNERGLLSMAFAPDFATSGEFYLYYTASAGESTIERFAVDPANPDRADVTSGVEIYQTFQPFENHNGGRLVFGPDQMLYLGIGDGGNAGDPQGNGQDGTTVLGSILRMDVMGQSTFAIPADNPFIGNPDVSDLIYAYGLRNPWRMSFDRATGDLYIADVGQNDMEEINFQAAAVGGGQNYGWNAFEGTRCFAASDCSNTAPFTFPIFEYDHSQGCSVTGGEVYRGNDYPALNGTYLYSDFCSGVIWGLKNEGGSWVNRVLLESDQRVLTFGEDERGNVYLAGRTNVFLISDGEPVNQQGIPMDGSFSGTYVVDGLNDQGFFVTVGEQEDGTLFVFVAWFTFDQGEPLWLVGVGFPEADSATVDLPMERLEGLNFLEFSADLRATRADFGSMGLTAIDCDTIEATYDFFSRGSGTLTLHRLTGIEGRPCELDPSSGVFTNASR